MNKLRLNISATVLLLLFTFVIASCKKDDGGISKSSSIKIIPTTNEPNQVKMITSNSGAKLAYVTSGDVVTPYVQQELFILNNEGEIQQKFFLSDTVFQHMDAVKGINGGFFVCATTNNFSYIAIYNVNDEGAISWSKSFPVKFGTNKNRPRVIIGRDNNYLVMYQSLGSGYYIWKGDANGNEIFNTKIPTPNAIHYGSGLNYGEKFVNFFQFNDTLIAIQGITFDEYDEIIANCFVKTVYVDVKKEWYSTNYDSTTQESGAGFAAVNNKIVLFGSKATNSFSEYSGDIFARRYSTSGTYEGETLYPRVGGTPNFINEIKSTPDNGYLITGSNNQYTLGELVSPNQIILMKLDASATLVWSKAIPSAYPAKGFDVVVHADGTIGLIGLLKEKFNTNKLIYLLLDNNGNIINN